MTKKPFALIILDGWGYRTESAHNPTRAVPTPTIDHLFTDYPHVLIEASGPAVGLPVGQMGNSEVGHLHIGAGRKVPQDLVRINHSIHNHSFFKNPALLSAIQKAKSTDHTVHIIGLLSDGGVHSHIDHICAMFEMLNQHNVTKKYFHAILDGRDTLPKSALSFISRIEKHAEIASVIGRYYAMDRDNRWERTQKAYDLLTQGSARRADAAENAVKNAYARGETDEFISPTSITNATIEDGDVVIFMNFRADRARQLTKMLVEKATFADFVTLTNYFDHTTLSVAYPPLMIKNTLGEFLSTQHLTQLRLAETEKYAHVTYFLNGGVEEPYPNECRTLIPSLKIATYDLQPEMSAIAVTNAFVSAIEGKKYDVIICNYANPDMIGHTGIEFAARIAVSVIDDCLKRVLSALEKVNGEALITSDHGNIELMVDEKTGQPHTAHTMNMVPLIYVGKPVTHAEKTGALDDVAPTMLYLMGLEKPVEMTGNVLFQL